MRYFLDLFLYNNLFIKINKINPQKIILSFFNIQRVSEMGGAKKQPVTVKLSNQWQFLLYFNVYYFVIFYLMIFRNIKSGKIKKIKQFYFKLYKSNLNKIGQNNNLHLCIFKQGRSW